MRLATLIPRRHVFLAVGALTCAVVFALFLIFERPGLGIGHGFYLAVIFISLAGGPTGGLGAGLLATALYAVGIWINPHVSPATIPTLATSIRAVSYVAVGVVVGWYASRNRTLNRRLLEMTNELQMLAQRDVLTGLPNTRAFEPAITRRIDAEESFALLVADVDGLKRINTANGYDEGNDLLRNVAERLSRKLPSDSDISRVGDDNSRSSSPPPRLTKRRSTSPNWRRTSTWRTATSPSGGQCTRARGRTRSLSTASRTSGSTRASSCAGNDAESFNSLKTRPAAQTRPAAPVAERPHRTLPRKKRRRALRLFDAAAPQFSSRERISTARTGPHRAAVILERRHAHRTMHAQTCASTLDQPPALTLALSHSLHRSHADSISSPRPGRA